MYQFSYAEIMEDGVADSKDRERQVLDRSIALLAAAKQQKGYSREAIEAILYPARLDPVHRGFARAGQSAQ